MTSRNVEIKAKINDFDEFLKTTKSLCAGQEPTILKQKDTFFNSPNGRLKLREFEATECNPAELIFYDRSDSEGPKLSRFYKSSVVDVQIMKDILSSSMGIIGEVRKTRYLFLYGQTRIHIDDVENLGTFMELEVCLKDNQNVENGEKIAKELMGLLNIDEMDLVKGAYMDKLRQNDDYHKNCNETKQSV